MEGAAATMAVTTTKPAGTLPSMNEIDWKVGNLPVDLSIRSHRSLYEKAPHSPRTFPTVLCVHGINPVCQSRHARQQQQDSLGWGRHCQGTRAERREKSNTFL